MTGSPQPALDHIHIRETIAKYGLLYDEGELDAFVQLFTEDAVVDIQPPPGFFDVPVRGRDAIERAFRSRYAEVSLQGTRRHVITNTVVDLDGDRASATSMLIAMVARHSGELDLLGSGVYRDVLRRVDGAWLFAERRLTMDTLKTDKE